MHPTFKQLFIDTDDDDLAAEGDRRRRMHRSRRARPAKVVRPAARHRDNRPRPLPATATHSRTPDRENWMCEMPAAAEIALTQLDMNSARCRALFSSGLQPSDAPTAGMVATAISRAVQQFGIGGCAGRMAQEYGDHPDAAARRMRWVRQLIAQEATACRSQAGDEPDL